MRNLLDVVPVATVVILVIAVVGGISVVTDDLTFKEYVAILDVPLAGLAIGRGLAARKPG